MRSCREISSLFLVCLALGGCAHNPPNGDPLEKCNRFFYDANEGLDRLLLKPAADLYVEVVPRPVRTGLGNVLANLFYGKVILNDLLQGKIAEGVDGFGRMAVNSTFGIGGIFDVATRGGLPAHYNDFGITLGKWSLPAGCYLFVPVMGPTTPRDAAGVVTAILTSPLFWASAPLAVTIPVDAVGAVAARSRAEGQIQFRNRAAIDPYVFTREAYLQYRAAQIRGPKPAAELRIYEEE
jgi:phospholipid-binding lipoprotein MlaA